EEDATRIVGSTKKRLHVLFRFANILRCHKTQIDAVAHLMGERLGQLFSVPLFAFDHNHASEPVPDNLAGELCQPRGMRANSLSAGLRFCLELVEVHCGPLWHRTRLETLDVMAGKKSLTARVHRIRRP